MSNRDPNFGGGGPPGGFQGGGYPYPMPYPGMPMIIREGSPQQPQQPVEPPLRVQIALALNGQLTRKQMPQVAVTENQIETIKGQELTAEEMGAQATAMNAMSHYLAGSLVPDVWEKQSLSRDNGVPTLEARCVCRRQDNVPNPECPFCAGEGIMDIVVKNPRKAVNDGNGNIVIQGEHSRTRLTNGVPAVQPPTPGPGPQPGRRPRPPREPDAE